MTAEYPTKITTQLRDGVARLKTVLTDDIAQGIAVIPVAATAGFPDKGFITIDNETKEHTGKTAYTFTGCSNINGNDVAHEEGAEVRCTISAAHINRLNEELIATQTKIGITGAFNFALYGKNLLLNPSFESYNIDTNLPDFWDLDGTPTLAIAADTLFPARGGNQITITATGQTYEGIQIIGSATNWLKILPNTKYTFSVDYKVTDGDFAAIYVISHNGAVAGTNHVSEINLVSTTAIRVTYTFTTDADADNLEIALIARNNGDIVYFSHPKLEQGAIATPYIPQDRDRTTKLIEATNATPDPIIASNRTQHIITALGEDCEFAAPTGDIRDGDALIIRIKDDGTARALSWNAIYRANTEVALPTTTVISKTMYVLFIYNSTDTKWDLIDYRGGI